jgi:hypothetical protein
VVAYFDRSGAGDCSSSAFPKERPSRIGCILTCGSDLDLWVKNAWPRGSRRPIALGVVGERLVPADSDNETCLAMQNIEGNEFCLD